MAGIGKSTLVRGALELRRSDVRAVWIACEGQDAEQLLSTVDAGLELALQAELRSSSLTLSRKTAVLLGALKRPCILVFDGFEALLDDADEFRSQDVAALVDALTSLDHSAKVLVSTRRLPRGVGEGSSGVKVLYLGGLAEEMARTLFQTRAHISPSEINAIVSGPGWAKLRGVPKLIELLASAVSELPASDVMTDLLDASEIGEFVVDRVLGRLSETELTLLQGAVVFRDAFALDALVAVANGQLNSASVAKIESWSVSSALKSVRRLVRGAVLDISAGDRPAYYLHPIIRDAVPRSTQQEADGHAAAAAWFFLGTIDPHDPKTWDQGLYHLRRAAEVGPQTHLQPYADFLDQHAQELEFAGWPRRLVDELRALTAITDDPPNRIAHKYGLGVALQHLGEVAEAMTVLREVDEFAEAYGEVIGTELRVLIKYRIGSLLVEEGQMDAARAIAAEIKPIVDASINLRSKVRYWELCFDIARHGENGDELLASAQERFRLAIEWHEREPDASTFDAVAEAYFALGVAHLRLDNLNEAFTDFLNQLRIKLAIAKISGVPASLFNLASMVAAQDGVIAGAMFLVSEEMKGELELQSEVWEGELTEPFVLELLSTSDEVARGREFIGRAIAPTLLPFFDRGVAQRATSAAEAGPT